MISQAMYEKAIRELDREIQHNAELEAQIKKHEDTILQLRENNDWLQHAVDEMHKITSVMCSEYYDKLKKIKVEENARIRKASTP